MIEVVSLIVSIVLGLPSLILFLNQKKQKLVYLESNQINIQEDFLKNFNDVKIRYKDKEINSNLTFIKGYIIVEGDKDITSKNNYIEIISPETTNWVDFKVISKSKGLTENSTLNSNTATIYFDLMKAKENFEFEGIIEKSERTKAGEVKLDFFHRIPNLNIFEILKAQYLKNSYSTLLMSTILLLFGLFVLWTQYSFDKYNLSIIDDKTKQKYNSFDFVLSKSFDSAIDSLNKETNGIFLLFVPSRKYEVYFKDYHTKTIEERKTIYFKRDLNLIDLLSLLFSAILIVFSTYYFYMGIYLHNRKKYLKYISGH